MVTQEHYKRLKHLYAASPAENAEGPVDISYGFASIGGVLENRDTNALVHRMPHQRLLSDASMLAAGSVEKEGKLTLSQFSHSVNMPSYEGPVSALAEVMVAEPPRYHVRAVLLDEEGEEVAESIALFEPSGKELPPDPNPDAEEHTEEAPPPAPFMPIHVTPHGVLCLN